MKARSVTHHRVLPYQPTGWWGAEDWMWWRVRKDKPQSGEERRQALVRAAFGCIAERGFEGLRLREVAAEVGIDHSTLHHYFATKEDLVAGVINDATRQFWPTMPAEGSAIDRLQYHLAALGRMIREQPALFTVMAELDLRARRDPGIRAVIDRHEEGWRVVLEEVLGRAAKEGALTQDLAVPTAVELIIAAVKGVRQLPDRAEDVLAQLNGLLAGNRTDGG
jgi:AcrR family transcriptional regulator